MSLMIRSSAPVAKGPIRSLLFVSMTTQRHTGGGPDPAQILDDEACRAFQGGMDIVGKRWTGAIMLAISRGARRFGQILRLVDGLSDRLLSQRLKELAAHGLVTRTIVPTTPAYSEYELTPLGEQLIEAMQPLVLWGYVNRLPATDGLEP